MVIAANLGFPRIGANRELKKALESYWKGELTEQALKDVAKEMRKTHWTMQHRAGIKHVPSNDFSYYDQVLDTIAMVGAVPERYGFTGEKVDFATYFAMARGVQHKHEHKAGETCAHAHDASAMEMTKWFDTNYHYIVPELHEGQKFRLASDKIFDEFKEAKLQGLHTRPVLLGPVSFLLLAKMKSGSKSAISLLPELLPVYERVLKQLAALGADWVQVDEPCLVLDLNDETRAAYKTAYEKLAAAAPELHIMLTTYFGDLRDNLDTAVSLPVDGLHIDLVRAPEQLDAVLAKLPAKKSLSVGVVNGRNIWRTDLDAAIKLVEKAVSKVGSERVQVAASCSLQFSPVDLDIEDKLDAELKSWLAFAKQKLAEIAIITKAVSEGHAAVKAELESSRKAQEARRTSTRIHNLQVKDRAAKVDASMRSRKSAFAARIKKQQESLNLPLLPTTTIGSYPQTAEVRAKRADFKAGKITAEAYDTFLKEETARCVKYQEEIGIDVLVHGEFERNDMVEYFGEQLDGFTFTKNGWVQSYGARCVKPPVIFGDVARPKQMTVEWAKYAQSLTKKEMKGMLTGPVTILQWSFVRDDQPRSETCRQIALAIRDEVADLEAAGIKIIQIDEAAIREGLPLRRDDWKAYLDWAVDCFRISASVAKDETQIHTHMCYSEFNDIIAAIADMDADVISIETSRSQMELLDAFVNFKYPNQIGPGVYDIHSPRVPSQEEMEALLRKALSVLSAEQIWVNPDCGLKTRGWAEVKPALEAMVAAAEKLRGELQQKKMAS
ncbi:MAG TPA: 5-methyltetrahydropteroyltriglutamate--homocysteine S-methyltransferase [Rickettsiales bacterium]|nr:5-methyltetrahydropteroyltriglutamate--homocysteine S-methyltransferase [Rickettsiales bacterium]